MRKPSVSVSDPKTIHFRNEILAIVFIFIGVFAFRSVAFEPFRIPSGSMIPTLYIGDFILVNKASYGLKIPFSDVDGTPIYIYKGDGPERGDVIVFQKPGENVDYIKRVIGLPGDEVFIDEGEVYINGTRLEREPIEGREIQEDMDTKYVYNLFTGEKLDTVFYQAQTGDHNHVVMQERFGGFQRSPYPPRQHYKIPPEKYFVMGDNRDHSQDSRAWGYVPFNNIKGRAFFIWFNMTLPFLGDSRGEEDEFRFRPWRIGKSVD